MLGSQEKILEPKVNVKFFTVDPYTPCYRVSRPFPIWSIWQIWPLLGQKNMFFGGLVNWGNEIWIVFGWFQGFLGHQNYFWKFQKVSKILTKNSVKNTGHFSHFNRPNDAFFSLFLNFLSQPSCGKLRKIKKSPKKRIVLSVEAVKVKISEINTFHNIR